MTDATAMSGDDLNFIQRIRRDYSPLVIIMVGLFLFVFLAGATLTDDFLTWFNVKTIIRDAALVGIMAIGLTFVTLSGNFFLLSMKEIAALSIICFATLMGADWNQWGPADGDPTTSALDDDLPRRLCGHDDHRDDHGRNAGRPDWPWRQPDRCYAWCRGTVLRDRVLVVRQPCRQLPPPAWG